MWSPFRSIRPSSRLRMPSDGMAGGDASVPAPPVTLGIANPCFAPNRGAASRRPRPNQHTHVRNWNWGAEMNGSLASRPRPRPARPPAPHPSSSLSRLLAVGRVGAFRGRPAERSILRLCFGLGVVVRRAGAEANKPITAEVLAPSLSLPLPSSAFGDFKVAPSCAHLVASRGR